MICIFCKNCSDTSTSVEHIIPESLGNTKTILPKGIVCDTCNNYFSRKVEAPVLNHPYFRSLRSEQSLPSKRGRATQVKAVILPDNYAIDVAFQDDKNTSNLEIIIPQKCDFERFAQSAKANNTELVFLKHDGLPPHGLMSRFLAKMAIEALAFQLLHKIKYIEDMTNDSQLDEIRTFARRGGKGKEWPYSQRRIYNSEKIHIKEGFPHQLLHEFDFLFTEKQECYFVIAIFGIEYAINLAGSEISGYEDWLIKNNNKSPLYL